MTRIFNAAAVAVAFMAVSGPAPAFTLNTANKTCIGACDLNDLSINDMYRLTSGDFLTTGPSPAAFDIGVRVVRRTAEIPYRIRAFNTTGLGGFVQLQMRLLNPGGDFNDTFTQTGTRFNVAIEDIDSNSGGDFTEFAGVNLDLVRAGSALTAASSASADTRVLQALNGASGANTFDPNPIPDLSDFTYAYATGSGPTGNNWTGVPNASDADGNDPAYTAVYDLGSGNQFDFIWGTSVRPDGSTSTRHTRGWNISLSAEPIVGQEVPEIDGPVLAQVGFVLAGLYFVMVGRRRRDDSVDMRLVD